VISAFLRGFWQRVHAFMAPLVIKPAFWAIFFAVLVIAPISRTLARDVPKPPPMKLPLPAFELTNERGERFGSAELRGRVYVADFVFTSCPTVCPKLTERMARIQHRTRNMGQALQLVTFTVDPENDTPEKLAVYARSVHANPSRWSFLTGPLGEVETTVVKGFKLAMGKEQVADGIFSVFHGERFVLVDQGGAIRGYYDATDEGVDALLHDAGLIANLGG
jgi:protein SCO1